MDQDVDDHSTLSQKVLKQNNELEFLKNSFNSLINQNISNTQNQLNLLKNAYEMNHPDKKEKSGFVQISKNNKIISLENLSLGDEVSLQTPKYIATCTVNEVKKQ